MKHILLLNILLTICLVAHPKTPIDSVLVELKKEVDKKDYYIQLKYQKIDSLKKILNNPIYKSNLDSQFKNYLNLFNEYKSFIYDSAFNYAIKVQQTSLQINDQDKIALSKINLGFILISSGMYKEAFDTIQTLQQINMSDSLRKEYYLLLSRAYIDLKGYDASTYYTPIYDNIMNMYLDSALVLCKNNTPDYFYYLGLKNLENGSIIKAQSIFEELISQYKIDNHLYAMASSSLAYLYLINGQPENTIKMLAEAVKADIKSSTKETIAANKLAEILFEKGYIKEANFYIQLAMDDASFYKANLRKRQIYTILPIIAGKELSTTIIEKKRLLHYAIATSILSFLVVVFLLIIYKHLMELRKAKKYITDTNTKLLESNKIKDEYIGYYLNISSEYIDKIEKFKKAINRKLVTRRIDDIDLIINNINSQKEREELFTGFDKVFLKLFPDFVSRFNLLLKEEDRIKLKENQLLNTDLRIFALIRIGINDHEKIAKILDYSVSTIYNYKSRIKNKSIVSNDRFEDELMEIRPILPQT